MNAFDPRYMLLQEEKLKNIISKEATVKQVAVELSVSRQTIHKWLSRYKRFGTDGLIIRRKKHHTLAHNRTSPAIEQLVVNLAKEYYRDGVETGLQALNLTHWWSRPKTPKDNPKNERFNRTLKEEFLRCGNYDADPTLFNPKLTEWLVEYNAVRPHQALGYRTPLAFAEEQQHLSTMWSSSTST